MKMYALSLVAFVSASCAAESSPQVTDSLHDNSLSSVLMDSSEGCLEGPTEQFGRYIGDWDIQDWQLQPDGTWAEQKGARWNFICVGNGIAVQDFWMPNGGGAGTNLRIYDPKTETWQIAWTASGSPGFTHISAKEDESGNIVMDYVTPKQTPPRRIIFYAPTEMGWNWGMEISSDEGKTWREVYKIKATHR